MAKSQKEGPGVCVPDYATSHSDLFVYKFLSVTLVLRLRGPRLVFTKCVPVQSQRYEENGEHSTPRKKGGMDLRYKRAYRRCPHNDHLAEVYLE